MHIAKQFWLWQIQVQVKGQEWLKLTDPLANWETQAVSRFQGSKCVRVRVCVCYCAVTNTVQQGF